MPELGATRLPTRSEIDAWRAFLRSHAKVTRCLEAELLAEQRLSLGAYDVLAQLAEAEDQRLRMAELAEAVLLSRSGVTRLVDRLERAGLVIRERVDGDGRGVVARLTPAGANRLGIAARTHLAGVVRHFVELLDEQELATIAQLTQRIADAQP
ncbi:DNA-binding MarR family transcriptional regulator [Kibdelosporangium banguiense]|uniref:DNA-binding MarR family transcriptional regulator n=1 Tax=Kibdelosporangium banguiense TaxID=1365924 RepID=A0ABS4T8J1_9PSEU|nr:MarR family transcriptional regulator [Kibdelosporangium banguiense]MBP2320740.1 DNA-binding MarR family transcriptional regulator [Kibdelosporangium banguiense]